MSEETRKVMKSYISIMSRELKEMYTTEKEDIAYIDYETFQIYWWKLKKLLDTEKKMRKKSD